MAVGGGLASPLLRAFRPDYLVIGHVTKDLQEEGYTIRGTVTFAGLTARNLGRRVAVVTRASSDLDLSPLFQGVEVLRLPFTVTTTFQNLYHGEVREQFIRAVADRIEAEDIPPAWRKAGIVHLAPLAGELDASIIHLSKATLPWPRSWL